MSEEKKPLTESERLEMNTAMEYAKQRTEEFQKFFTGLIENANDKMYWKWRADVLELTVLAVHMGVILILAITTDYGDWAQEIIDWSFLLFVVVAIRSWWHHSRWCRAEGELEGAIRTLEMLDMAKFERDDSDDEKRKSKAKAKSPFKRFKEFWERIGKSKEAYA